MTRDITVLLFWADICLAVAAVCLTAFPVLYMFSPWYSNSLGRAVMLRGLAFALAIDLTLLVQFWRPKDILVLFWMNALVFTFLAGTSIYWTVVMVRLNYKAYKKKDNMDNPEYTPAHAAEKPSKFLISDAMYDKLKPVTTMLMPAIITFWLAVAGIWHLPNQEEVAGTLGALNVLLGVVLLLSSKAYKNSDQRFDGTMNIFEQDDKKTMSLDLNLHPEELEQKDAIVFKVANQ